ncbi:hypothetical protein VAWG006_11860 [Aeromonas enteropelogenes]|uniref:hypothetical protein n=1 Tax=Aeromonas enteropelogenes TaxID=29489 RepID=UPI002B27DC2E|nr:hypothetical protein VAWG006_11860 [Aeromonas enteropelogenes]BEE21097.1 hypothetical protein VAWG007_11920 [Aeromonas enteropelogenes]
MQIKNFIMLLRGYADIYKNILFLCVEKFVFVIVIFYVEAMVSRELGVLDYGKWLYALNIVIVISSCSLIAGAEVVVPMISKNNKLQWFVLTSAFILRMLFSILSVLLLYIYVNMFVVDELIALMIVSLIPFLLLAEPFGVVINYYQARVEIGGVVLARLLSLIFRAIIVSFAIWLSYKGLIYFSRSIEVLILASILVFLFVKEKGCWSFSKRITRLVFFRGLKLWIPLILMYLYMRMDRFFVEKYLGFNELAFYGVAVQIFEQLILLIGIVIQSIGPKFIFKRVFLSEWKVASMMLVIVFAVITLAKSLLPHLIAIVFGDAYIKSTTIVINLLPALIFYTIDMVYMQYIYRRGFYTLVIVKWIFVSITCVSSYHIWFSVLGYKDITPVFIFNYVMMFITTITLYQFFLYKKRLGYY